MARNTSAYDPATPETVRTLIAYHNAALASLIKPDAPYPDPMLLRAALPQGSLTSAEVIGVGETAHIAAVIKDRTPRLMAPEAYHLLRSICLFTGGGAILDKNQTGPERKDYIEVLPPLNVTFQRLMIDAQAGEQANLNPDNHYDLRPETLTLSGAKPETGRGRREVIAAAIKAYDKNAVMWGLASVLSRDDYRALLRAAFKLFDIRHGHHFLRPIAA